MLQNNFKLFDIKLVVGVRKLKSEQTRTIYVTENE